MFLATVRSRIYMDTSVIGGCLDADFQEESQALLEMARRGEAILLVSSHLAEEIAAAPSPVQDIFETLPADSVERIAVSEEALALQKAYLEAGVLGQTHAGDALHVAIATVVRADLIVSWNFRHIVHLDKIRRFNAVNLFHGYPALEIRSPREVA